MQTGSGQKSQKPGYGLYSSEVQEGSEEGMGILSVIRRLSQQCRRELMALVCPRELGMKGTNRETQDLRWSRILRVGNGLDGKSDDGKKVHRD